MIATWPDELPEIAGLPLELAKRAARLTALMDQSIDTELERLGLTRAEFDIVATLRRQGAPYRLRPTDLSKGLLLSSGGTATCSGAFRPGGASARATADALREVLIALGDTAPHASAAPDG
ncbi:hypothetical protein EF847_18495 [Actinobacteria bacterium YIM 96077]|uniref:MarR family transcriptional regulator n=1 Tax=Phytoactinopolyspora halophila TaxID=1981511 RepID=A0A329QJ44_9ACTN|nr:hypothetical protein EF847_18495 [Actinobacteria bacterium YIM 96077]RAW11941.1 hypothetical protein DPM12_15625 [Phytoactinopolyspora halophila]